MLRLVALSSVLFALVAPGARAASPYGKAVLVSCDKDAREATFEGRVATYRRAAKMQLRFTLRALTPETPHWRRIDAPGFGAWITAPAGYGKYTYDKTVEDLLSPASYRAVVDFRWRDRRGRTIHFERATSPACRQPDARPDLVVRDVRFEVGDYSAEVYNRGREAAGPFAVDFTLDGAALATVEVPELAPRTLVTVLAARPLPSCALGSTLAAVADPLGQVDEADEENNAFSAIC